MNKDNESRAFNPRQRIVGAVILVVLAIVVVPLVLNKRERPADPDAPTAQTVVTDLPASDGASNPHAPNDAGVAASSAVDTASARPDAASAPAATDTIATDPSRAPSPAAPSPTSPPPASAPAAPSAVPRPAATQPPMATKPDLTRETGTSAAKGWYVQVGTFANDANAAHLAGRLRKAGFKVVQERVRAERNSVVRVRVGPYGKEAQARIGQARIHKAVGIKGLVRHY